VLHSVIYTNLLLLAKVYQAPFYGIIHGFYNYNVMQTIAKQMYDKKDEMIHAYI
jgi:hypothetical protein